MKFSGLFLSMAMSLIGHGNRQTKNRKIGSYRSKKSKAKTKAQKRARRVNR